MRFGRKVFDFANKFGKKALEKVNTFGRKLGDATYKVGDTLKRFEPTSDVGHYINKHIGNTLHDVSKGAGALRQGHLIEAGSAVHLKKNINKLLGSGETAAGNHDYNNIANHSSMSHLPNYV